MDISELQNIFKPAPLLAAALLLVIISASLFFRDYRTLRQEGIIRYMRPHSLNDLRRTHQRFPLSATDADSIREWMTFTFINTSFAMPADYLKTALAITDRRYPNVSITEVAEGRHEATTTLLEEVKGAVRVYYRAAP